MLENISWNTKEYQKFIELLFSLKDVSYQKFQSKLFKEDIHLIGVRTPILKRIAMQISKTDYNQFIKYNGHFYYEEKIIHGFLIGFIKKDFDTVLLLLDDFIKYNDAWAINDLTCANLKCFKQNKKEGFVFIQKYITSKDPWKIRFALVLLLSYYIEKEYIGKIFILAEQIKEDYYYVKMANAWLLSICYIKYPKETKNFLEKTKIDDWTYHKTISKICDSQSIKKEEKEILKKSKRK